MLDDSPYNSPASTEGKIRPRRLRYWFLGGFGIVFIGMLILVNQYVYTGDVMLQCKLWQFYLMEIRRALTSPGTLGPSTGSGSRAFMVLCLHTGIAGVAGLISLGVGALVTRSRS